MIKCRFQYMPYGYEFVIKYLCYLEIQSGVKLLDLSYQERGQSCVILLGLGGIVVVVSHPPRAREPVTNMNKDELNKWKEFHQRFKVSMAEFESDMCQIHCNNCKAKIGKCKLCIAKTKVELLAKEIKDLVEAMENQKVNV